MLSVNEELKELILIHSDKKTGANTNNLISKTHIANRDTVYAKTTSLD
jgi:hypothetical protein